MLLVVLGFVNNFGGDNFGESARMTSGSSEMESSGFFLRFPGNFVFCHSSELHNPYAKNCHFATVRRLLLITSGLET